MVGCFGNGGADSLAAELRGWVDVEVFAPCEWDELVPDGCFQDIHIASTDDAAGRILCDEHAPVRVGVGEIALEDFAGFPFIFVREALAVDFESFVEEQLCGWIVLVP